MKRRSELSLPHSVVFAFVAVACGLLVIPLVQMGTAASDAAVAVLILAALVSLGFAGSRLRSTPDHPER